LKNTQIKKFPENWFSESRGVVPCGRKERQTDRQALQSKYSLFASLQTRLNVKNSTATILICQHHRIPIIAARLLLSSGHGTRFLSLQRNFQ
jgi:hypothetical protein